MTDRRVHRRAASRWLGAVVTLLTAAGCAGAMGLPGVEVDPDLRGNMGGAFIWALEDAPDGSLDVEPGVLRDAVAQLDRALPDELDEPFPGRVVALFPTIAEADTQADRLRELLARSADWFADPANADAAAALRDPDRVAPLTRPEIDAMLEAGTAPGERGVGWGGDASRAPGAVVTAGPFVVVTGIEDDWSLERAEEHPLVKVLRAYGAAAATEGDRGGEGSIVADVSCRPTDAALATRLLDEVGDAFSAARYFAAPPWSAPVTPDQALARATIRRWQQASMRALNDAEYRRYVDRLIEAVDDPAEYQAILDEMEAFIARRAPDLIDGPVDAEVLALVAGEPPPGAEAAPRRAWLERVGARIGQLPLVEREGGHVFISASDFARSPSVASVRLREGRLELGWAMFGRFSSGGLEMVAWLVEQGCGDVRLGLVDFDAVRGD